MPKLILCKFVAVDTNWVCSLCGTTRRKQTNFAPRVLCKSNIITPSIKSNINYTESQHTQEVFDKDKLIPRPAINSDVANTTMPKSATVKKKHKCGECAKKVTKALIQKSITESKQTKQIKLQELRDKLDKK